MTNTTTADAPIEVQIENTLHKTNLGDMINKHKKSILISGGLIIVAVIIFSIYQSQQNKKLQFLLKANYSFTQDSLKSYKDKKLTKDQLVDAFNKLDNAVKEHASILPLVFDMSDTLIGNSENEAAAAVLESVISKYSLNSYSYHFLALKLATIYENQNKLNESIEILERLVSSKLQIYAAKVYFDLGRLYVLKGDNNKAKNNFNHILNTFAKDPLANMSKLYLEEINAK